MEKLIGERKQLAASVTYGYVKELKKVLIGGDIPYVDTPALEYDKLNTSLKVLGPITIKQHIKDGDQYVEAANDALRRTQGAAVRHTYGGARELLDAVVAADQDALGWKRVTSSRACDFCSMLAGRGAVYKSEGNASFTASGQHYHDNCKCTVQPLYLDSTN